MDLLTVPAKSRESVGPALLSAHRGKVQLVAGVTQAEARACLEHSRPESDSPLALFVRPAVTAPADAVIEDLVRNLCAVAAQAWPIWYTNSDFGSFKDDTLGTEAARARLRAIARKIPDLSIEWARAAVELALRGKAPRPKGVHWSIEIAQLCLAIHAGGLVLVIDVGPLPDPREAHALVHALELVAYQAKVAIVLLCETGPAFVPPYDRLMVDSFVIQSTVARSTFEVAGDDLAAVSTIESVVLAPITGRPHPLSEVEKKVARAIAAAPDLEALFRYNQIIETVRGSRPKVDLLWPEGRLVVELDGYQDHSKREMFIGDRHRDYELALSGYTVLRIANEEVLQDVAKAVDKIRDMVELLAPGTTRRG